MFIDLFGSVRRLWVTSDNSYLLRGELKDVPKGHDCYELYKMV